MDLTRRRLLAGLGAALGAPLHAAAQSAGRVYRIGFLGSVVPTPEIRRFTVDQTWDALRSLGWEQGRNYVLEERWAEGRAERLPGLAAQLVQAQVDLIVVGLTDAALAAKGATHSIPIITVLSFDPARHGLIQSYARPGGNVTGLSYEAGPIGDKLLDLLRQAVPGVTRVGVLWNPDTPTQALWLKDMEPPARTLKLELRPFEVRAERDLEAAFQRMKEARVGGLVIMADAMMFDHRRRIAELAVNQRLPSISVLHEYPQHGGLMSYVIDIPANYRRVAVYIDKVLRGAKPADLPVEQPTKFELIVNLKTARAMGLTFPPAMLLRADRVIE
jgi:putative tryptophan/tyrosine transport system substrate-binding protein